MLRLSVVPALSALLALAALAFAGALSVGSVAIDPVSVLRALVASGDDMPRAIVRELRLPRAIAAFASGGCLALGFLARDAILATEDRHIQRERTIVHRDGYP